ncbi:hypothetical protein SOVF_024170 [Spinacia oleracea]|uniref:Nucleoplasmin-like domain-containing protein n=1 Tax=Spinacia oleracea TaxID=3562 RepID=A0A9R0IKZ5_SPIOL|nr:uncharacterized protein LOC110790818 [Spinacia oleracea]KNA23515.1 hypothetical protein SOVF_024170 [Spinacia oleracea]
MAEQKESSQSSELPPPPPLYLEVTCASTGKVRRFAPGTKAGFALTLMNNKLDIGAPLALYIQAVKFGEEPISFGPTSVLLSYGHGWNLQTVLDSQRGNKKREGPQELNTGVKRQVSEPTITHLYIGKIVIAFLFIFLLGGIFTVALENLPRLMLFINSSL